MSEDKITGKTKKYAYDENRRLTRVGEFNSSGAKTSEETIEYDGIGRVTKDEYFWNDDIYSMASEITHTKESTEAGADGQVKTFKYIGSKKGENDHRTYITFETENTYDSFKRITKKDHTLGGKLFTKNISYTRARPTTLTDKYSNNDTDTQLCSTGYTYDSMGRITKITVGAKTVEYTYDEYGQLTKEVNNVLDKTIQYVYNGIGNLTSVTTTPTGGTATTTTFTYGNTTHPDRLTAFNEEPITYNSMGCVTNYDGKNYTWRRGKLGGFTRGSSTQPGTLYESFTATYDALGRRTSKNYVYDPNPASTSDYSYTYNTKYTYDNSGRLIRELITERFTYTSGTATTKEMTYLYDESGIIGCVYSVGGGTPTTYYFQRNLLGDVVGIYNTSGTKIAEYVYDAFGNCSVIYGYGNDIHVLTP